MTTRAACDGHGERPLMGSYRSAVHLQANGGEKNSISSELDVCQWLYRSLLNKRNLKSLMLLATLPVARKRNPGFPAS